MSISCVVRLLLELGGIETNPGPTNHETLECIKQLTAKKVSDSKVEAARTFFGKYNGTSKILHCAVKSS